MGEFPHTTSGWVDGGVRCSCGATWTKAFHFGPPPGKTWGTNCPSALREALATVTAERDELRKVAEAVRAVAPYVTATIARNNSFKTEHPDWIAIHGGRASSSEMQLESLLRAATAALRSNDV